MGRGVALFVVTNVTSVGESMRMTLRTKPYEPVLLKAISPPYMFSCCRSLLVA